MKNIFRMSFRLSIISSCFGIISRLPVFITKQGNSNLLKILSLGYHSSNQSTLQMPNCKYGFEGINNVGEAVVLFNQMLQMQPDPTIKDFNKLLNIVVKLKSYSEAVFMFKRLSLLGYPVNDYTMNIVINCYCNLKEVELGFAIMASFLKFGYAPDIASINCLMKGLLRFEDIKNIDEAVIVFHRMLTIKPMPPMLDFSKLFNIVVKMKEYSRVICMFKELSLLGGPVDEFIMSTVIKCYCNLKEVELCFAVIGAFLKLGYAPNIVSFTCIITGLCKNGMVDDAMRLSSKMIENGIFPNVVTYTTLIQGLCSFKRWDEADKILTHMMDKRIYPNGVTFTGLINSYCKEGLIKNAEDVMQTMIGMCMRPSVFIYNVLMNGCWLHGQPDKAKDLFRLMAKKGLEPDLVSYCTMVNGYLKHNEIDQAWEMFKEMLFKGLKPDTVVYSCMMQGLFSVGRCIRALELFDEMKVVGLRYNIYTYGIVLDGLLNNGKFQDAMIFYHEVESKGLAHHVSFYTTFIHGLCNNNQLDFARSIFDSLTLKGLYPDVIAYNVMMKGLCQEGLFREVEELLEQMDKSGCFPNSVTYNTIIRGCLKHYDSFDSSDLLRRIAERDFTLNACTSYPELRQMQGSDEDHGRKSLIQKLISR